MSGKRDNYLIRLVKQYWTESGGVYGYRKIHTDIMEYGESFEKTGKKQGMISLIILRCFTRKQWEPISF